MTTTMPDPEVSEWLRLHEAEGWTWREIATHYGTTIDTVRKRAKRYAAHARSGRAPQPAPGADAAAPPECEDWTPDDWIDFCKRAQKAHDHVDPVITRHTVTIHTKHPIAVQYVCCMHLGSRWVQYDQVRENHDRLCALDGFYWIDTGDPGDNFPASFKSATAIFSQLIPPKMQRAFLRSLIGKAPRKYLAAFAGNHDGFDERLIGENLYKAIWRDFGIPFFDGKGELVLRVGPQGHEQEYIMYLGHKLPGNSLWNPNHPQNRALQFEIPSADVVVSGHTHTASVTRLPHHIPEHDAGRRASLYAWLVQTGTAKAGNDEYSIKKWTHGVFEWPTLVFSHDRHLVRECQDPGDLPYFLGQ